MSSIHEFFQQSDRMTEFYRPRRGPATLVVQIMKIAPRTIDNDALHYTSKTLPDVSWGKVVACSINHSVLNLFG